MKHDPRLARLARLEPHPGWCGCRLCARRAEARADVRETIDLAVAGAIVAVPAAAAILIIDKWPAIVAAAGGIYG
jgi:hypothetical protein